VLSHPQSWSCKPITLAAVCAWTLTHSRLPPHLDTVCAVTDNIFTCHEVLGFYLRNCLNFNRIALQLFRIARSTLCHQVILLNSSKLKALDRSLLFLLIWVLVLLRLVFFFLLFFSFLFISPVLCSCSSFPSPSVHIPSPPPFSPSFFILPSLSISTISAFPSPLPLHLQLLCLPRLLCFNVLTTKAVHSSSWRVKMTVSYKLVLNIY
jgi:hypothetical protein